MDCSALFGMVVCGVLAGEPATVARGGEEYVRVGAERSVRRYRYRYRSSYRRRSPRVVIVYRDREPVALHGQATPGPCDIALVERRVKTEFITTPAAVVRGAFEELSVHTLVGLGPWRGKQ